MENTILRQLRDAARSEMRTVCHCSLAIRTLEIGAPAKPKRDEVNRLAAMMVSKNKEGYQLTVKGSALPFERGSIKRAPPGNYRVVRLDTGSLHEITFGTLGRGLLSRRPWPTNHDAPRAPSKEPWRGTAWLQGWTFSDQRLSLRSDHLDIFIVSFPIMKDQSSHDVFVYIYIYMNVFVCIYIYIYTYD